MVTFTLPEELRSLARSHQKLMYDLLFRCSAAALQDLAQDPRFVGGQIGMVGVLQTWARDLSYHPHVHYLVPGGGVTDAEQWQRARNGFLVHVKPLSSLFRGKFRAALEKTVLYEQVPAEVWHAKRDWVVHCQAVGSGEAALKYMAPYIFRVAISNNRIVKVEHDQVTFRYFDNQGKRRYCTLPVLEFMRRSLCVQHVLPKGFKKVRYYGLFSPAKRELLNRVRLRLLIQAVSRTDTPDETGEQTNSFLPPGSLPCPTVAGRCAACSNLSQFGAVRPDEAGIFQPAPGFDPGSGCFRSGSAVSYCLRSESRPVQPGLAAVRATWSVEKTNVW